MKTLCGKADYLIPNLTEACFLTDIPYTETYDRAYIDTLLENHWYGAAFEPVLPTLIHSLES